MRALDSHVDVNVLWRPPPVGASAPGGAAGMIGRIHWEISHNIAARAEKQGAAAKA
jgi:hypothetical protein